MKKNLNMKTQIEKITEIERRNIYKNQNERSKGKKKRSNKNQPKIRIKRKITISTEK